MSSRWTNKYAIMRDLSIVQGCVPGDIEGTVGVGEKPPAPDLVEETEEEFYRKFIDGDDASVLMPDFEPIKVFLDMVNENSSPKKDVVKEVFIDQHNPPSLENIPINALAGDGINARNGTEIKHKDKPKSNKNKNLSPNNCIADGKNVACNSKIIRTEILENSKSPMSVCKSDNNLGVKLSKPRKMRNVAFESIFGLEVKEIMSAKNILADYLPATEIPKKVEKVTKEEIKKGTPKEFKVSPFLMNPSSMFKVKEGVKKEKAPPKPSNNTEKPVSTIKQYVPTKQVDEYYKRYVERSQVAKQAKEDIWERAERIMKEIDLKRKLTAELQALQEKAEVIADPNTEANENKNMETNNNNTNVTSSVNETEGLIMSEESKSDTSIGTKSTKEDVDGLTTTMSDAFSEITCTDTSMMSDVFSDNNMVSSGTNSPPLHSSFSEGESSNSERLLHEPYLMIHRHSLNKTCVVCQVICKARDSNDCDSDKIKEIYQAENWRVRDE